ncbi:MAG: hypothetical protein M1571_07585 [Firmicutes bacterium]|nr:hypothetical protein [Bacillota bacterium]
MGTRQLPAGILAGGRVLYALPQAEQPAANYTNYYIAGAALLVVLAGMTVLFVRRRAC